MIIVTSISPQHSNQENQHVAIGSWSAYGECYSLNCKSEIEILKEENYQSIDFIETTKTIKTLTDKPLVSIFSMFEFAIGKDEDLLIINSDIVIRELPEFNEDGITVFSRFDYTDNFLDAKRFENGYDGFFIPKKFLHIFPFSIYSMGSPYWDYKLPFCCMSNKIPMYYPEGKFTFHKLHPVQYPFQEYLDFGYHFQWENKIDRRLTPQQVAAQSLSIIKSKLIRY